MTFKGIQNIIPDGQIKLLEHGRTEEVEQGLLDLGYLENNQSIAAGILLFRKEYRAMELIPDYNRYKINFQTTELDPIELNLLHALIALDGDFVIKKMPAWETSNLCTRVIHYRLETLGLYEDPIGANFNHKARQALHQLAEWLHMPKDLLPLVLLSGDIPALIIQINADEKLKEHIVCFRYHDPTNETSLLEEISEEKEDHDDEEVLEVKEAKIDQDLKALEKKISAKEKEVIEDFDLGQKTKSRRKRRVNKLREKINKTLVEQNTLFQKRLQSAAKENVTLVKLQKVIDQITKENKERSDIISFKEVQLKNSVSSLKETEKAQKDIRPLQRKLNRRYKHLSNDQFKTLLDKQGKTANLLAKQVDSISTSILQIQNKQKQKQVKKQLKHVQRQQNDAHTLLKNQKKEWQIRVSIQEKLNKIKGQKDELAAHNNLINEIGNLNAQLIFKETELKSIVKEKKRAQRATDRIIQRIKSEQEHHQLEIQSYKKDLDELLRKINNLNFRFKAKLSRSLSFNAYQEVKREIFTKRNIEYLDKKVIAPFNCFLIRLIQVHQWTNGYYYGKLDSELRHRSFDSIADLVEDIPRLRLKYILTLLGSQTKGYWILNVAYLFKRLVLLLKEDTKKYTAADVFKKYEKEMNTKQHKVTVVEEAWKSYTEEIKEGLKQPSKIRRIYYGIRSLARSIMRCFVRLIRFIIRGIKKLITLFKNFIKLLYKEIREGVRKFKQGIGFLFGKRQLETIDEQTGKVIITKYDFDFDTKVIAPPFLPEAILWKHHQKCMEYTHNLDFSMILLGKILNWIWNISKGPFGWAKLAIRIAIYFKNLVIEWLKRKRSALSVLSLVLD